VPKGLPSVEQVFVANVSGYVEPVAVDMVNANKTYSASVQEMIRWTKELQALGQNFGKPFFDTASLEKYVKYLNDAQEATARLTVMTAEEDRIVRAVSAAIDNASAANARYAGSVDGVSTALEVHEVHLSNIQDLMSRHAENMAYWQAQNEELAGSLGETSAVVGNHALAIEGLSDIQKEAIRAANDFGFAHEEMLAPVLAANQAIGDLASNYQSLPYVASAATSHIDAISDSLDRGTASARSFSTELVPLRNYFDDAGAAARNALIDTATAADWFGGATRAIGGGSGGGGGGSGRGGGGGGGGPLALPPGAGENFSIPIASGLLGGSSKAALASGSAAWYADNVTRWLKTAWPYIHYTTMALAELAATVVPAAVALGAASFVGLQGAQQGYSRVMAINAVMQSLGGAYGGTTGSFLGLQPKLQALQNYAQGGVYEIGGAGLNMVKSGFGSAFGPEGVQTIAMIDRGIADMQNNMQAKGTGQQLGDALAGGTGYLRQFGDIGSNLGNLILGMTPHLPGVGGDWISALEGITGGLSAGVGFANTHGLGEFLSAGMAGEAGWRLGTPLVGFAGKAVSGLGTLASKLGLGDTGLTASKVKALAAAAEKGNLADIATPEEMALLSNLPEGVSAADIGLGGAGLAGLFTSAGGAIGALTGPETAGLSIVAQLVGQAFKPTAASKASQFTNKLAAQIGNEGFTSALGSAPTGFSAADWTPLGKAITETTGLAGAQQDLKTTITGETVQTFRPHSGITTVQYANEQGDIYSQAAAGFTRQMSDLIRSGPQIQKAMSDMGIKGASLADAFQFAQNSLLDLSHAFGSNGKLNQQAMTMMKNYGAALVPMTQNAGALGAAIGAQTIMSQGSVKQLQEVNQSMDSMTSVMTGGAAGMSSFFGLLGGAPVTQKKGGINLTAPPSYKDFAQALTSFSSAGGASAWNTFAGSQGLITAEEQNLDQIRTAMTLTQGLTGGAGGSPFTPQMGQGLAGFQLEQLLPMTKNSSAALAMVMQQMSQVGIGSQGPNGGYYDTSKSLAQNYKDAEKAMKGVADNAGQANAATRAMTISTSEIPAIAKTFSTTVGTTLQSKEAAQAATDLLSLQSGARGGTVNKSALRDWVAMAQDAGVKGGKALTQTMDMQLKGMGGFSGSMTKAINSALDPSTQSAAGAATAKWSSVLKGINSATAAGLADSFRKNESGIQQAMETIQTHALGGAGVKALSSGTITFKSKVEMPTIPHVGDQIFNINGHLHYPSIPAPHDQSFNIVGHVSIVGGGSATFTGGLGNATFHSAHGMLVPGHGSGDVVPAMLEPGEAVVPKHLVPSIAPFLGAHKVPGFALGGIAEYASMAGDFSPFGTLGIIRSAMTGMFSQILTALSGVLSSLGSGNGPGGYLSGNPFMDPSNQGMMGGGGGGGGGSSAPRGVVATAPLTAVPVHVASVASSAAAALSGGGAAGGLPMPAAAQKILDAFEKTFAGMGSPWGQFASELMNGLVANVKNPMKETAAQMTALTNQVSQEVTYGQGVAAAAKQGTGYNPWGGGQTLLSTFTSGLATPTTTAGGQPYQYYTDQANIAGGGTVSVQQQMSDYLQAEQSFKGDLGKLTKGGLNKNLMQQLIAAGPLQGDQEAQSILSGAGGAKGANSLWKQINAASNQLGISSAESVYGAPKNVKVSADVAAAQSAINSIHGKTVTIHVQVDLGGSGGGGGGGGGVSIGAGGGVTLSSSAINSITQQVQKKLLQQAKRNRRTGITLPGYGS
jgi:hypothetical protein